MKPWIRGYQLCRVGSMSLLWLSIRGVYRDSESLRFVSLSRRVWLQGWLAGVEASWRVACGGQTGGNSIRRIPKPLCYVLLAPRNMQMTIFSVFLCLLLYLCLAVSSCYPGDTFPHVTKPLLCVCLVKCSRRLFALHESLTLCACLSRRVMQQATLSRVPEPLMWASSRQAGWGGAGSSCSAERRSRRRWEGGHALGRASVLPRGPWRLDAFYCPHLDRWCPSDRLSGPGCVGVAVLPRVNSLSLRCLYLCFSAYQLFNVIVCGVDAFSPPSSDHLTAFLGLSVLVMLCWTVYSIIHFLIMCFYLCLLTSH